MATLLQALAATPAQTKVPVEPVPTGGINTFQSLLQRDTRQYVKMVIFGDGFTGKTRAAGRLAKLGYTLVYIDMDNASLTLKNDPGLTDEDKSRILLIPINDIIRIEASGSYSTILLLDKKKITASKNLSDLEHHLEHYPQFLRIHKSNIININYLERYIKGDGGTAVLKDGAEIEVARRRKDEFLERTGIK